MWYQRALMADLPNIDGHTRPFAVLGHPIGHTLSPRMHNAALRALGWNAVYLAFDVAPDRLMDVLPAMRTMGFNGVNLTVPLKEVAFRGLDRLDDSARLVGSVNTVQFTEDGLTGHSTDGYGFLRARAEAFGGDLRGRSVFLLGAGGAGRALALVCAQEGAGRIVLADVDRDRAERVRGEALALGAGADVRVADTPGHQAQAARDADLIVQATPLGMKSGDPLPLPPDAFRAGQQVFDLIYMYPETAFMKAARAAGAQVANGLDMLLYQGVRSFQIWTGVEPPADVMRTVLRKAVYPS
jgi:shikimate dehydrogenase